MRIRYVLQNKLYTHHQTLSHQRCNQIKNNKFYTWPPQNNPEKPAKK